MVKKEVDVLDELVTGQANVADEDSALVKARRERLAKTVGDDSENPAHLLYADGEIGSKNVIKAQPAVEEDK